MLLRVDRFIVTSSSQTCRIYTIFFFKHLNAANSASFFSNTTLVLSMLNRTSEKENISLNNSTKNKNFVCSKW